MKLENVLRKGKNFLKKTAILGIVSFPLFFYGCEKDGMPRDGTWEGRVVDSDSYHEQIYPNKKMKMIVENNGTKVTYFYFTTRRSSMGISRGDGWDIKDNKFKVEYFCSPSMYGSDFCGTTTGEFSSSKKVEGEYDIRVVSHFLTPSPTTHSNGTWSAKWVSSSTKH